MANTWIVTTTPNISSLVAAGRRVGGTVTAVVVGEVQVPGVDAVRAVPLAQGQPAEAVAPAVANAVTAAPGDLVLIPNLAAERSLAGAIAATLGAAVVTGATAYDSGVVTVPRYGGISIEQVRLGGVTVVVMDGGTGGEGEPVAAEVADTDAYEAAVVTTAPGAAGGVSITQSERLVVAGRGFAAREDLQLARDLAEAIGAAVACSRPLAEGSDWMPKNTYVGASGQHVAPDLYIAVGISGQLHHTVGATESTTIVVINSDEGAPYFRDADYGIVGDLYDVLPALTEAVK